MVLASWVVLSGLPFQPAAPSRPGEIHTELVVLTGPHAVRPDAGAATRSAAPAPTKVSDGWSTEVEVDPETVAAGITWSGSPDGEVRIRGHQDAGWTPWFDVDAAPDEGPDGQGGAGGFVWLGGDGVGRVQVQVVSGSLADLKVQTMSYTPPAGGGLRFGQIATAGAADTRPSIEPRSSWTSKGWAYTNEDCENGPSTAAGGVKYAVVHHTVNSNTYTAAQVPGMLAAIYTFHTTPTAQGGRGWCDIAYNFVIDRFGRTWEARSGGAQNAIVGGHAAGFNTGSVGVSFLGQYQPGSSPTAASPSSAAVQAAGRLIGWKLGLNGLDPNSTVSVTSTSGSPGSSKFPAGTTATIKRVVGHRDVGLTDCPGSNLYAELATIRATARTVQLQTTVTIPPSTTSTTRPTGSSPLGPFPTASALVTQQYRDFLRRSPTAAESARWVDPITRGTTSAHRFIAELASTAPVDDNTFAVIRLYKAYFLRNPDHGGYSYWSTKRFAGVSLFRISQQFALSSEFRNRYGALSNAGFVDRVYRNVMGRAPDAAGQSFWVAKLAQGMPRGQVMASFSESTEYIRTTRAAVQVVGLYEVMVQRTIPQGTYDYLEPRLRGGLTDLSGIARYYLDKPEYAARF
jgi:hypothetical protein